jgi:hypothetical protein
MPHNSLKLMPGVDQNKTPALNEAAISESQLVRFIPDRTLGGLVQKLGGWTRFYANQIGSTIRALWAWEDTNANSYLAVGADGAAPIRVTGASGNGTTATLTFTGPFIFNVNQRILISGISPSGYNGTYVVTAATSTSVSYANATTTTYVSGGTITGGGNSLGIITSGGSQDITPEQTIENTTVDFSTTAGNNAVVIVDTASGTNDYYVVDIQTQISVGGIVLFGQYQVSNPTLNANQYTIYAANLATSTVANGGAVPLFTTANGVNAVSVTLNNHGYLVGDTFPALVATSLGGVTIYGNYTVNSVTSANVFVIAASTSATSSTSASMNGGQVHFLYHNGVGTYPPGAGYGIAGYGFYGYGGVIPTAYRGVPINATDWTLDNWGQILIANPLGGPIYAWDPTQGTAVANIIVAAPPVNQGMFVAMPQRQIIAWGTTFNGITDPMLIRWCDVNNYDDWTATITNQAGSYRIPKGSTIIQGIQAGQQGLIWTDLGIWAMQYVGPPYVYQFNELGTGCGLIGRKAAASMGGIV